MLDRSVVLRPGSVQLIDARGEKFVQSDSRVCMSCRIAPLIITLRLTR